jgi:hypothetical protein
MRVMTKDEADNCLHFMFSWLQSAVETREDVPCCIFIQGALQAARQHPDISPWPEDMVHIYDQTHTRWVSVPPLLGIITIIPAHPYPSSTTKGELLPSQARLGTASLLPPTPVVMPPPSMTVVGPTETFNSLTGHLSIEGMILDKIPSNESHYGPQGEHECPHQIIQWYIF